MPETAPLTVGTLVADTYEIERLLGRGGMGEVWAAKHRRLPGKSVAIKVLHLDAAQLSPETYVRFRREAEVAAKLSHPNVVTVLDFNVLPSGAPYLVLELLEGESLSTRLARGAMSLPEVQDVVRQVGAALQAAHAHGVVHRDLKPDNVYLCPMPFGLQVKVLDFGISKLTHSATVQTKESALLGTPQYMSPEQALGNNAEVGPQTDVFALAAITYEMLSGRPPFSADSVARVVFRIAYEAHDRLQTVVPHLPEAACAAVERGLEKDKAKRTRDVATFVFELTGSALPNWAPTRSMLPQVGGVATPGADTPEELMLARTSVPTPVGPTAPGPVAPHAMLVPPTERDEDSTTSTGSGRFAYVLVTALLLVGGGVWLSFNPPGGGTLAVADEALQVGTDAKGAKPEFQPLPPPPPPKVVDSGAAVVADVVPPEPKVEPVRTVATGVRRDLGKVLALPGTLSAADRAALEPLRAAVVALDGKTASELAGPLLRNVSAGHEALASYFQTLAYCLDSDLARANASLLRAGKHRADAVAYCQARGHAIQ